MSVVLVGSGLAAPAGAASANVAAAPVFVQQVSTHVADKTVVTVTPAAAFTGGNRLVVQTAVWSTGGATASTVTDAAGDVFTRLLTTTGSDGTELAVWTAPVAGGAGARPAVRVTPTASADLAVVLLEYSGLAAGSGTAVLDTVSSATGTTSAAGTVSAGPTSAVAADGELALGFYADSGWRRKVTAGTGFTARVITAAAGDVEVLAEDEPVARGATPAATAATGAHTPWVMATVVLRSGTVAPPTVPAAPTAVVATAADGSVSVSWSAPADGGSPITAYTVTPYSGTTAGTPVIVGVNPPSTSASVPGLTNGTTYTVTVSATNAVGTGAAATSNPVTPTASAGGSFGPLQTWPIEALATHLLHTGEVVAWDGWQQPQPTVYGDATTPGTLTTVNAPDSVFCDGAADLPDGRLLVIGGYGAASTGQLGIADTNIFDPVTHTWTRVANMHSPRWYPTLTQLADGRYLALSGNSSDANTWADTPEVYDPTTDHWTSLTGVNTSTVHEVEYPFTYLTPSGKVFVIGPEEDNSHLLDVDAQTWTSTGASGQFNGSSVMYRPGKILYSGGAALINTPSPSYATTSVIDLTAAQPAWRRTAPMNQSRIYHTLTMLADGTVLAVGGSNTSNQSVITTGVLPTEIWDPATETWTPSAPIAAARNYHSTAILLPDGRVLVAGGGHSNGLQDPGQYSGQIYSPAYLSKGPRPTITSAPTSTTYGGTFGVTSPDAGSITGVNLVSLGADTHQIDMNQHFVPLSYTTTGSTLSIQAPAASAIAPAGWYMLFVLRNGVPSVSTMIHIGSAAAQSAPAAPTGIAAAAADGAARVSWTAPADNGAPISSYTVTPSVAGVPQTPTTVTGNPPATSTLIGGLTNGTSYTFTVTATNAAGTGPASAPSAPVTPSSSPPPAFVQSTGTHRGSTSTLSVTPTSSLTAGDRLLVQIGVWSNGHATARTVVDSSGDTFTRLATGLAPDGTELSVWSAPLTGGAGARPSVTVTTTGTADIGMTVNEYSGLSTAPGTGVLDGSVSAGGRTTAAATVSSGATGTATANDLAVGLYADSGFGTTQTPGAGWAGRAAVAPDPEMDLFVEDRPVASGSTATATVGVSAAAAWTAAAVLLKPAATSTPAAVPATPTDVSAVPGNGSATVTWTPPATGGSALTGYTVTPRIGPRELPSIRVGGTSATATVAGLHNGVEYNFAVTAINRVGRGPLSTLSASVVPTAVAPPRVVSSTTARRRSAASVTATPSAALRPGDRLVVEAVDAGSRVSSVTDAAGDRFTRVARSVASDGTELTVWTAPVAAGRGESPAVTAHSAAAADLGLAVLDYSGLSGAAGTGAVDVAAAATGLAPSARPVSSGSTAPTSVPHALSIGFYASAGNGAELLDPGYIGRAVITGGTDLALAVEDRPVTLGAVPAPSVGTGAHAVWLATTVVFRAA